LVVFGLVPVVLAQCRRRLRQQHRVDLLLGPALVAEPNVGLMVDTVSMPADVDPVEGWIVTA
jgi:hypothetical protein